ncbi:MAG TPA: 50S ribosomal protein L33 [Patescibacteria group bacterium]|nr:50S ribosomal protein L33 [Patescibacteria group bacterium]
MSQERLIILKSVGDSTGKGKGHIIYSKKSRGLKTKRKIEVKKFNPIARKVTVYKESK